jgi:hypothetical protein
MMEGSGSVQIMTDPDPGGPKPNGLESTPLLLSNVGIAGGLGYIPQEDLSVCGTLIGLPSAG